MSARISSKGIRRLAAKALLGGIGCLAVVALAAPAAQAAFGFSQFGVSNTLGGEFSRQAGAHADLTTVVRFGLDESIRDITVDFPPGMIGDPTVTERCTNEKLANGDKSFADCPNNSQVGVVGIEASVNSPLQVTALYNIVQPADAPALLGFNYQGVIVYLKPNLRPASYAISTVATDTTVGQPIAGIRVTLWAVPADSSHDSQRGISAGIYGEVASSTAPRLPFLTNPTSCPDVPTPFTGEITSWQGTGPLLAENSTDLEGTPFQWSGCERLPFEPKMKVSPGTHRAASTTGLEFKVTVPQSEDPGGIATDGIDFDICRRAYEQLVAACDTISRQVHACT